MIENTGTATVATGKHIELMRLLTWRSAAKLHMAGLGPRHASLKGWRQQFNSTATRWAQVEREVLVLIENLKKDLAGGQS